MGSKTHSRGTGSTDSCPPSEISLSRELRVKRLAMPSTCPHGNRLQGKDSWAAVPELCVTALRHGQQHSDHVYAG